MIATRFNKSKHANILGYNIINEPWAGNVYKVSGNAPNMTNIILSFPASTFFPCVFRRAPGGANFNQTFCLAPNLPE